MPVSLLTIFILPRITKTSGIRINNKVSNKVSLKDIPNELKIFFNSCFLNKNKITVNPAVDNSRVVKFKGNQSTSHAVTIDKLRIPEKKRKVNRLSVVLAQIPFSLLLLCRKRNPGIPQIKQIAVIISICEMSCSTF